ncbi:MAG: DUF4142 domain-containing protein [Bryobacterales bacterium]|nr:DUF4142 domain-containing protein [Bryobacterales bacterium]
MKISSFLIAALVCGSFVYAQKPQPSSSADATFVQHASEGGMAEVQLGQLAQQKGTNPAVKNFGARMVMDHSKGNDQLKAIATQKGLATATAVNSKDQALYNKLNSESGSQFDMDYINAMIADHKEDIAEFEKEANSGQDPDVKKFAMDTLPTLREHLKMAETAQMELQRGRKGE